MIQTKTCRSIRRTINTEGFKRGYGAGPIGRYYEDFLTADCPLFVARRLRSPVGVNYDGR